ncbi:MAG TPA: CoA pyrophosphatase [Candidatus Nitrosotalea sp.]|nr:CoA pyrophosphatase [Candidatus Nitrosotalea sp.]
MVVPILASTPPSVIFVERAAHLRRHPGQIAFPGGIEEPGDAGDPVTTALRELGEELGIGGESVNVIGSLPEVEQFSSRFRITPVVAVVNANASLAVDGEEIADAFTVPLSTILEEGRLYRDDSLCAARARTLYAFDHGERHIWGFTARILKSFVDAWSEAGSPLRKAAEAIENLEVI